MELPIFERANAVVQPKPPRDFFDLPDEEVHSRIAAHKQAFGKRLLMLGHHYQMDDIIKYADLSGDSYRLSKLAAAVTEAEWVIFLGVHFMAESADVLTSEKQRVILPDLRAGCTMADMANIDDVSLAWDEIAECTDETIVPITYMNSAANLKDFVGRNGGAVCTSSNAEKIIDWAFKQGTKLLFFPDQHLGRNTCYAMGYPLDSMIVWDPTKLNGGNTPEAVRAAKVLLWKGHCSVHQGFTVEQIQYWKKTDPDCNVLVHPECKWEVVQAADLNGSTSFIIKSVEDAPAGSSWAIGTEIHLVNRLKEMHPDKNVFSLSPFQCLCATMYRIRPAYLLWILDNLAEGRVYNEISVPAQITEGARLSLQRMIDITG